MLPQTSDIMGGGEEGKLWWGCGDSDEQFFVCVQYTWDIQRYTLSGVIPTDDQHPIC